MAKRSKLRPVQPADPEADRDEGPVDDTESLIVVASNQTASGLPQGIAAAVVVYAVVRVAWFLVRIFRAAGGPRS